MFAPASSFEDPASIARAASVRYSPEKLFLGLIDAGIVRDEKTGERYAQGGIEIGVADDRHVLTVAGSRAGKGRAAIIPNMLRYRGSVLAIDPKGELALATAQARGRHQRVHVIDPFNTTAGKLPKDYYAGYNPLALMGGPSLFEDSALIADALVIREGKDPHWDESARSFILVVIMDVASSARFADRRNLTTVNGLIAEGERHRFKDGEESGFDVLEAFMLESDEPMVRRAAIGFFGKPENERESVLSTARRHLAALSFPELERSLQDRGPDLAELKTAPTTIYLCLPGRHLGTCGRWLRLFVSLALQAMEKTPGKPATGCPVLFVLDEFAALGHMREIEDAAGQIAGFRVKLWPILQDLGQLKALYRERWETFMGNAGVLQFFGNSDLTTLEWISKRIGSTTIEQASGSKVTPGAAGKGASGESYAPRTTPILEPDEVALVFGRSDPLLRQLIIRPGFAPMILQRAYYDKHEAFRGLL